MIASKTHTSIGRGWFARVCRLIAALGALGAAPAFADWAEVSEPIATHETWIYTPNAPMPGSAKHGLLVVLHGCMQDAEALKGFGNLTGAADRNGLVLALPEVGWDDQWIANNPSARPECWDYDRALDKRGHVKEISSLARTLINRPGLQIDPDHVYVVGLSSGGALSLLLGCAAPDIFAGVAAIAGPSVGSDQNNAAKPGAQIPRSNIKDAARMCSAWAAPKNPACLRTQIANIAYGAMDQDGPGDNSPNVIGYRGPGQYAVVSTEWSEENVKVLRGIYGIPDAARSVRLNGATAKEWPAGSPVRLAEIEIYGVGHGWPAGRDGHGGGAFIARKGLDYPSYIAEWFERHNARAGQPACHS
jgi:poly(3-hydroxybutyrate) depolymerase